MMDVQQFRSIKAVSQLSCRPYYQSRLYFETSHGKSKSDLLRGVVKSFVSRSVNSEGTVVRNAMEFYQFCTENLTFQNRNGVVNNRCFILVKPEDLENSWEQVANCPYKTIPGTQMLHQIETLNVIWKICQKLFLHLPTLQRPGFQKLSDNLYRYFQDKSLNSSLPL